MGNIVNSSAKQPRNSDARPSESHDDSIFLEHGTHVVENILHKTTNRLNSSGSDYNNGLVRRSSQRLASSQREDQYWLTKLAELETYDQWDKQYLLDTMLRDAIILERPVEIQKLISLGADVHQSRFPQFSFRQAQKSIYEYAVETKDPNIVSILIKAGCCQQNDSAAVY